MSAPDAGRLAVDRYDDQRVRGAESAVIGIGQLALVLVKGLVTLRIAAEIKRREAPAGDMRVRIVGDPDQLLGRGPAHADFQLGELALGGRGAKDLPVDFAVLGFDFSPVGSRRSRRACGLRARGGWGRCGLR